MQLYGTMYGTDGEERTKIRHAIACRKIVLFLAQLPPLLLHPFGQSGTDGRREVFGDLINGEKPKLLHLTLLGAKGAGKFPAEEHNVDVADLISVGVDIVQLRSGPDTEKLDVLGDQTGFLKKLPAKPVKGKVERPGFKPKPPKAEVKGGRKTTRK